MRLFLTSLITLAILSSFVFGAIVLVLLYTQNLNLSLAIELTIGINVLLWIISPFISDFIYRVFYKVQFLSQTEVEKTYPAVFRVINSVAGQYKFRFPKFGIIPDNNPTAFSYGSGRFNARIVLTEGIFKFLNEDEVNAVVAHELGHVVNRDFMVMMIATTLVQVLYEIYAVLIRARGKNSGNAKLIALAVYVLYFISLYIVLFLSRTREYLADRFSTRICNPENLANALIKIGYGIVTTPQTDQEKHLLHSTRHLGIVDVHHAANIGIVSYITSQNPEDLAEVMVFDKVSPWARLEELQSTHPLTGKRIGYLSEISARLGKPFSYDVDGAAERLKVKKSRLYGDFFAGLFISLIFPLLLLITGGLFISWPVGIIGLAVGLMVNTAYKFPNERPIPTTILDEMKNPYASPIHGKAISLSGSVIGRGIPGYIFSADMMYQDKTGLTFLSYSSFFGSIGNLFFALSKIKKLFSIPSKADGWFFRGMSSMVALKSVKTESISVKSHPVFWQMLGPIAMIILAAWFILATGV